MNEYYLIGKISGTLGSKGVLRGRVAADVSRRLEKLQNVYVDFFDSKKRIAVDSFRNSGRDFYLTLKHFSTDEECSLFLEKEIFIDCEQRDLLPEEEANLGSIFGYTVLWNTETIGIVEDILHIPVHDILVVRTTQNDELLIPAVQDFIDKPEHTQKIIRLKRRIEFTDDDAN